MVTVKSQYLFRLFSLGWITGGHKIHPPNEGLLLQLLLNHTVPKSQLLKMPVKHKTKSKTKVKATIKEILKRILTRSRKSDFFWSHIPIKQQTKTGVTPLIQDEWIKLQQNLTKKKKSTFFKTIYHHFHTKKKLWSASSWKKKRPKWISPVYELHFKWSRRKHWN